MTLEEGAFVLGIAAGLLTKTNVIGLIGGGRVPSIWAGHEAFKAGVLLVNPNAKFLEYYAPLSWADVAGARRAAESFIAQGADVIFSSGDGIDVGVSLAASERRVWFTTVYADIPRIRPMDTLLGSIVFDWDVVYSKALIDRVTGDWKYGFLTATMASGIIKVNFGPKVPEDVRSRALKYQDMILMGLLKIYFDVDPVKGTFKCFDNPDQPECKPTAAKITFKG
jgi:basic membrane lipoprotein Med (substrate-binding protein (PBP1-ABC) superfamily)